MTQSAVTINHGSPFSEVEEKFITHHIRHLPVIEADNLLIGLITKRDLFRIISPRKDIEDDQPLMKGQYVELKYGYYPKESLDKFILEKVMTKEVYKLKKDNSVSEAIKMMLDHKIGCVVIVDNIGKVEGIVTRHDILQFTDKLLGTIGEV